ncbi:50S ribosomal protein L18 [Euzebya sp.]|uniref:50S ribosomal protein L18 n=1 Tax=Euzebya sp. TaxID=1971409 RepID=UPI0035183548
MAKTDARRTGRDRRHLRLRKKVQGDATRPRLAVYRSNTHIYAQVIDDRAGATLAAASSTEASFSPDGDGKVGEAKAVGRLVAERAKDAGIDQVVFDRGGNRYAGRVQALADAARDAGLTF